MNTIFSIRKTTLSDMIKSKEYDIFISEKLGNDLFINDPERADRLQEYAENGCNGSMHSEVIEDWREFLEIILLPLKVKENILKEIEACENHHEKAGDLYQIIN